MHALFESISVAIQHRHPNTEIAGCLGGPALRDVQEFGQRCRNPRTNDRSMRGLSPPKAGNSGHEVWPWKCKVRFDATFASVDTGANRYRKARGVTQPKAQFS